MNKTSRILAAAALAFAAGTACAQATIDHNKALAGNITPGDTPGYPITLSVPGHYKLMGNLSVPAGTNGINVTASNVTLDLNGFTVSGPTTCTRVNNIVACTPGNPASGVVVHAQKAPIGTTIRNGTVQGFTWHGILTSGGETIENVRVTQNGHHGVGGPSGFHGVRLFNVVADFNGGSGIVFVRGLVEGARVASNGQHGIDGDGGYRLIVRNSLVRDNVAAGLKHLVAAGTTAHDNKPNGIEVISLGGNFDGSTIY